MLNGDDYLEKVNSEVKPRSSEIIERVGGTRV